MQVVRTGNGYTIDSQVVRFVLEVLASFSVAERRDFIRFVTGSVRFRWMGRKTFSAVRLLVQVGGSFPAKLTVVKKEVVNALADDYLPSVNTCFMYLKVPEYTSLQVTRHKLLFAMQSREFTFN